jgi:iron complex outermembrane receptor protein
MISRAFCAALLLVATGTEQTLAQSSTAEDTSKARSSAPTTKSGALEEVVVTGLRPEFGVLRSGAPIIETARSVSIELEEHFRDKGAQSLAETLAYTAGVTGNTFGPSTRQDFPKVRGFDGLEYRDGQQTYFSFYNNTRTDVFLLEQVEILKGPASVLYGKGSPGGLVNAVSKIARRDSRDELVVDFGNFDRRQIGADYGVNLGNSVSLRIVGLYRDSDTQVDFVDDDAKILMPSITWESGSSRLSAMLEVVDLRSDTDAQFLPLEGTGCVSSQVRILPAAVCTNANGQRIERSTYLGQPGFNRYDTKSITGALLGSHRFTDALSMEGVIRYKDGEADYRQAWLNFTGAGRPRTTAIGDAARTFYWSDAGSEQLAADLRTRLGARTGPLQHDIVIGAAYQDVSTFNGTIFAASQGTLNVYEPVYSPTPARFLDAANLVDPGATTATDLGFYLSDEISLGAMRINLGVRRDRTTTRTPAVRQTDSATSVSAGLLYAFANGLSPYVSFAESFQPVIGRDGFTLNPLKPREGQQLEAGIKYQPVGKSVYLAAALFEIEESNLPNPANITGQPGSQQEGVGKVRGAELEAQARLSDWSLEGNVSYLDTEAADGFRFSATPAWQASTWVQYQPENGRFANVRIGAGLRYNTDLNSDAIVSGGVVSVVTDGALLADALIGYRVGQWDASLNVRNLADKDYYSVCLARGDCFPAQARSITARVGYQW